MRQAAVTYWHRAPKVLRRSAVQMNNIILVPASELISLHAWQQRLANFRLATC